MSLKTLGEEDLKIFYSISEVARHLGVNASLIRFWEKEFPQLKPRKNSRGERLYTKKDIQLLERIYHLVKVEGFTLEGARRHLNKRSRSSSQPCTEEPSEVASPPSANCQELRNIQERLQAAYERIINLQNRLSKVLGNIKTSNNSTLFGPNNRVD
ncbi:MAG: MerR family transcriptional regulator [Flavobacteriales bacterium]|nr:MerR family transcriptional regulator [Flavobacteriales bacterium]MCX7768405.1 MerR family transcriptional regulator [Flavobacteriales bacterium]MDW8409702.1 MerR family transcriptional regulator [Flavobacteriales bacterium]